MQQLEILAKTESKVPIAAAEEAQKKISRRCNKKVEFAIAAEIENEKETKKTVEKAEETVAKAVEVVKAAKVQVKNAAIGAKTEEESIKLIKLAVEANRIALYQRDLVEISDIFNILLKNTKLPERRRKRKRKRKNNVSISLRTCN